MTSEKQIAANKANAQKSTGPRTAHGKARSAFNALQHGLTATTPVLPDEDPVLFETLREQLFEQFQPATALESELVEDLVLVRWRLRRVPPIEAGILQEADHRARIDAAQTVLYAVSEPYLPSPSSGSPEETAAARHQLQAAKERPRPALPMSALGFLEDAKRLNMLDKLTRYETRLENRFYRLLHELARLQAQRVEGEIVE